MSEETTEQRIARLEAQLAELSGAIGTLKKKDNTGYTPGRFAKMVEEKRLVYAEIYIPDVVDAHGHFMTADDIELMAHRFLARARSLMIDVNHDNKTDYGCALVESFIARDGDPDYVPGSWVGVVFVGSDEVWEAIKAGELTGFSFEGYGYLIDPDSADNSDGMDKRGG